MPIDLDDAFRASVANSQKEWQFDRSETVGASEVFSCIRRTAMAKRFPEFEDKMEDGAPANWGHAERGNLVENHFAVPHLRKVFGDQRCLYMGEEQKTFRNGKLSATPDGVLVDLEEDAFAKYGIPKLPSPSVCLDIKTFGTQKMTPRINDEIAADKKVYWPVGQHRGQVITQMGLVRSDNNNAKPDIGALLYISPVDLSDIRLSLFEFDQNVFDNAVSRADKVFDESLGIEDYEPEGIRFNDCMYCKFKNKCNEIEMKRHPGKAVVANNDVASEEKVTKAKELTVEVTSLRAKLQEITYYKKVLETELKDLIFSLNSSKITGDGWSASVTQNKGRNSVNVKEAEAAGIDLSEFKKVGRPYFTLNTQVKKED